MHMRSTAAAPAFEDVRTIAVLRGGGIGDLVFTLPAIDALAAAYPDARIVLLGTPAHRDLLTGRPGPISTVELLPAADGIREADGHRAENVDAFVRRMRAERFDLACQLHGGGRYSNPFLLGLGARHTVGTRTPDAVALERCLPYLYYQHEVLRWLEVVGLAGASPAVLEPRIVPTAAERMRAKALGVAGAGRKLVVMHPGATDPRRRWPLESFVELIGLCVAEGANVLVVGSGADAALADAIEARVGSAAVASCGDALTLSQLVAVLAAADVVVGNDSGPRHLAQAVGTPTVGIFWIGNLINGGPLTRRHDRVQLSWTTRCPTCGIDATQVGWTAPRCEHDESFVADVTVDAVFSDLRSLLGVTATTAPALDTSPVPAPRRRSAG